ncbi:MAG TPA: hypothetical protein VKU85_14000 [bacterium]|nr:hypothetical protein [bacterium]
MKHPRVSVLSLAAFLAAVLPLAALAGDGAHADHDHADHAAAAHAEANAAAADPAEAVIAAQLPTYPLETCVVSGEPLDAMGKPVDFVHEGRLVRFCCGGCVDAFNEDPAAHFAKIDAAAGDAAAETREAATADEDAD